MTNRHNPVDSFSFISSDETATISQQDHLNEYNRLMDAYHLVMSNINYYTAEDRTSLSFAAIPSALDFSSD